MAGSVGWWKCSLHGRQGFAPANRLLLLSPSQAEALYPPSRQADKPFSALVSPGVRQAPQNIYQIPSVPRQCSSSPAYECMERIYEVPSPAPAPACWSPGPSPHRHKGRGSPSKVSLPVNVFCIHICIYDEVSVSILSSKALLMLL